MIREALFTDIDRIMNIWLTASEDAHDFITKEYWREKYCEMKENYIPKAKTFVYVENDEILGFVSIVENKFIGAIFVDIHHQHRGIGKELTDFLKRIYPRLDLVVYQKNKAAVDFYKKQDFKIVKKQVDKNTGEQEYVMGWKASEK